MNDWNEAVIAAAEALASACRSVQVAKVDELGEALAQRELARQAWCDEVEDALPDLLATAEALNRVKELYDRVFDEECLQTVNRDDYAQGWNEGRDMLLSDLREAIDGD